MFWLDLEAVYLGERHREGKKAKTCKGENLKELGPLKRKDNYVMFVTPQTVARQAPLSSEIFQARILEWVAVSFSNYVM